MTRVDSPVPLMHHDPDRSWITDPDPDHPKGTQPKFLVTFSAAFFPPEIIIQQAESYKTAKK